MPLRQSAQVIAEKYYVTTLALEQCLRDEDYSSSDELFRRRDQYLTALEERPKDEKIRYLLEQTAEVEGRIVAMLNYLRDDITTQAYTNRLETKAIPTYHGGSQGSACNAVDRAG